MSTIATVIESNFLCSDEGLVMMVTDMVIIPAIN
jgi:hypothetical protein